MNFTSRLTGALAILVVTHAGTTTAQVLYSNMGSADPSSNGRTAEIGSGNTAGPLLDDNGTGVDSWFTDDAGTNSDSRSSYKAVPTAPELELLSTQGWTLSALLRLPNPSDNIDGSPVLVFRNGTRSYDLYFGTQPDGDPVVHLQDALTATAGISGQTIPLEGIGDGYHLFELVYDPIQGSADLFVDSVALSMAYTGYAASFTHVGWGNFSSSGTGRGNFAFVSLAAIEPVPAASVGSRLLLGLILTAVAIGLLNRQYRTRAIVRQ